MISLETFVSETLQEIIKGVRAAQNIARDNGADITPAVAAISGSGTALTMKFNGVVLQPIEFDVAVIATEGTGTQGGVGVFVGPVALGSKGQSAKSNQSADRIRFSVPVGLRSQE